MLTDSDEPEARYDIDVLSDVVGGEEVAQLAERVRQTGNTADGERDVIEGLTYEGGRQYFLIKVTQKAEHGSSDLLWTAPVWFEHNAMPGPAPAGPNAASFVASRRSALYHLSKSCPSAKTIKPENLVSGPEAARGRDLHEGCGG